MARSTTLTGEGADRLLANVDNTGEGGLLGIAILPSAPHVLYLYVTTQNSNEVVRMLRFGQNLYQPYVIVTGIQKNSYHNGGRIRFGPDEHALCGHGRRWKFRALPGHQFPQRQDPSGCRQRHEGG